MTRAIGCDVVRARLSSFLDGELPTDDQLAVDAHLRWCRTCGDHLEDLQVIGSSLRLGAGALAASDLSDLDGLRAGVLSRMSAESSQRTMAVLRVACTEPKVLWAGVGATIGVVACVLLTMGVASVVMDRGVEDSMAAILDTLSHPGSDANPVALGRGVAPPRLAIPLLADDAPELMRLPDTDVDSVVTLATVVNRQGRVSGFSVLKGDMLAADVPLLHRAVAAARFAPAHLAGATVAVNMVWVMARTTVRGSLRPFDLNDGRPRTRGPKVG